MQDDWSIAAFHGSPFRKRRGQRHTLNHFRSHDRISLFLSTWAFPSLSARVSFDVATLISASTSPLVPRETTNSSSIIFDTFVVFSPPLSLSYSSSSPSLICCIIQVAHFPTCRLVRQQRGFQHATRHYLHSASRAVLWLPSTPALTQPKQHQRFPHIFNDAIASSIPFF